MQGKSSYRNAVWGTGAMVAICALLIVFVVIALSLSSGWLQVFDMTLGGVVQSLRSDGLTPVAKGITVLGKSKAEFAVFVVVALILLFKLKQRGETLVLLVGVLTAWGLNTALKYAFGRERPAGPWLIEETGFSFPSGHGMVSSLFYGLIGYLFWLAVRERFKAAWLIPAATAVLVVCIGLSRIYLGVHYPSDVLAGFAVGGAGFIGCIMTVQRIRDRRTNATPGVDRSNSNPNLPA
ncbi:phosphatase PAP2 family protein [Bacillus sp. 3255]|uniref:phosphatase PAP2 family protein n=1 Tax=Bacillus sp. 3255 TaxID=2817904 RepID=UPI002863316C|nr:phosphatase PAP2 family protein [Bacillus sp. 3255]MDR6883744.1 undecaprenyl-diphosphatase [Bacillus sp. 3255]